MTARMFASAIVLSISCAATAALAQAPIKVGAFLSITGPAAFLGDPDARARHFLVACGDGEVVGFVVGEVRDWEFGSPPCGWVFGIDVRADVREGGVGSRLLEAIAKRFRRAGVTKLRTMLARDNTLILSFFRSQGMMAAPFIPLEMDLDEIA